MPVIGERKSAAAGKSRGYANDSLNAFASAFRDLASDILSESTIDIFAEPRKAVLHRGTNETLKNFFMENSADRASMTAEQYDDHMEMMSEQFENDMEAVMEYAAVGSFNPVIGMTFPIHKNILMNNIFDKGVIPKTVAASPKFTLTMETRKLRTPDGKILDLFEQQNELTAAINSTAPIKETVIKLPEDQTVDVLGETFSADKTRDNLSIESSITAVLVETFVKTGETYYDLDTKADVVATADGMETVWFKIAPKKFVPAYGEYDRQIMEGVSINTVTDAAGTVAVVKGVLSGYTKENMFTIMCSSAKIVAVKLATRIDTSSAMVKTCSVEWSTTTDVYEIPSAIPINVPVSPDEVKDLGALYNVNQLTKIMSMIKLVLGNYKDDTIKTFLDDDFAVMPEEHKIARTFDFAPRDGYALDHVEWRQKTFMDALDTYVTELIQVLNDPNMTISVIGRPDLIRKVTPTEYTYQSPSSIGPIELDFVKTVTTSDKRVYQFVASDKLRGNNNLIIVLTPRNSERIIYQICDYQLYVSNEVRNVENYALPAIHAYERFLPIKYQSVQGRVKIINPTGLKEWVDNTDPIGKSYMNDFDPATGYDANKPEVPTP